MRRAVPLAMLLMAVSASTVFADTNVGTVSYTLNSLIYNQPTANGVFCGPYSYDFSNPLDNNNLVTNPQGLPNPIVPGTSQGFCLDYTQEVTFNTSYPSNVYLLAPASNGTGNIPSIPPNDPGIGNLNAVDAKVVDAVSYWVDVKGNVNGPIAWNGSAGAVSSLGLQLALWEIINGNGKGFTMPTDTQFGTYNGHDPITTAEADTALSCATDILNHSQNYTYTGGPQVYAIVDQGDQIQGLVFGGGQTGDASPTPEPTGLIALASLGLCAVPVGARKWRFWAGKVA